LVDDLGEHVDLVAVVGGSAPALYDLGPADVRETSDVDLIFRGSMGAWTDFMNLLRARRFLDNPDGPVCRLSRGDLIVDVVPDDVPEGRGWTATNRWYREAFDHRVKAPESPVHMITPLYFVATKLEAFRSSARQYAGDALASRDIEDVVRVIRGVEGLIDEVERGDKAVHRFIRFELLQIANSAEALGIIQSHLEGDEATQRTAPSLLNRLRALSARRR